MIGDDRAHLLFDPHRLIVGQRADVAGGIALAGDDVGLALRGAAGRFLVVAEGVAVTPPSMRPTL